MDNVFALLRQAMADDEPVAMASAVRGSHLGQKILVYADQRVAGTTGVPSLDDRVAALARERIDLDEPGLVSVDDQNDFFVDVYVRQSHLIIIGAVHVAMALCQYAKVLGFRVTVIDPRERFATPGRFPQADEIILAWPDEALTGMRIDGSTYVAILTHDPKFDEPALQSVLGKPARYIGAIGSRKTSNERMERLRQQGFSDEQLGQVHAPIGMPIGGRTPEEIALSIAAEMIAARRGRRVVAAPPG